ncbi:MAG: carboxymuconolactone decarboxylase family protein [Chloroflexota bacterium]
MSTVKAPTNPEADPRVKAVFDDIRTTRNTDFIGNVWKYLAFDPPLLESVWGEIKEVMMAETLIDSKTKEMIYTAVSIANGCEYCTHSHTKQAKAQGMTDAEHAELIRIVMLATKTNALADALQLPLDPVLDAG